MVVADRAVLQMDKPVRSELAVQSNELGAIGSEVAKAYMIAPNLKTDSVAVIHNIEATDWRTGGFRYYILNHTRDVRHIDFANASRRRCPSDYFSVIDYGDFHRAFTERNYVTRRRCILALF